MIDVNIPEVLHPFAKEGRRAVEQLHRQLKDGLKCRRPQFFLLANGAGLILMGDDAMHEGKQARDGTISSMEITLREAMHMAEVAAADPLDVAVPRLMTLVALVQDMDAGRVVPNAVCAAAWGAVTSWQRHITALFNVQWRQHADRDTYGDGHWAGTDTTRSIPTNRFPRFPRFMSLFFTDTYNNPSKVLFVEARYD